jgi:hypothetical protein
MNGALNGAGMLGRRRFTRDFFMSGAMLFLANRAWGVKSRMLRVETRGNPFSRGKQQGEACARLFHPWLTRRLETKARSFGVTGRSQFLHAVEGEVDRGRRSLQSLYPEGYQECQGLAAGLGIDETTFFAAHFFNLVPPRNEPAAPARQCTVVGLRDAKGQPLVGKTDDVAKWELGMNVMETTRPEKGYRHVHFHFAGTIWTVAGMNEMGLAMGMNGIPAPKPKGEGIPSLEMLHTVLPACATVADAIEHLRGLRLSSGGHSLLLGDSKGVLSVVEHTSAGVTVLSENRGKPLAHTNHILDKKFAEKNPPPGERSKANSLRRYENVLRQVEAGKGMDEIMNDRNAVGAICQRGEEDMWTDFGVVFSPVEKKFHFWSGYPGEVIRESVELKTLFG